MLGFPAADAGDGWLIFALPPAELAVHPSEEELVQRHAERDLLGAKISPASFSSSASISVKAVRRR